MKKKGVTDNMKKEKSNQKAIGKRLTQLTALIMAGAALTLTGCAAESESMQSDTEAAEAAETSDSEVAGNSEAAEETTEQGAEQAETPALKQVRITAHDTDWDQNYVVNYDEEGRIISLACYHNSEEAPTDPATDNTVYVEYDGTKVDAHYREEFLSLYAEDDPMYPRIDVAEVTDGRLSRLEAGSDAALRFAFDENGLPTHCMESQEAGDYAITYTQNDDGTYSFASAAFEVPGYFDTDVMEGTEIANSATFDGEVIYWE